MAVRDLTASSAAAIAYLDREDVRTIQAALQDANRRMQNILETRSSLTRRMMGLGYSYEELAMLRIMERNEELYNRIAQITGII